MSGHCSRHGSGAALQLECIESALGTGTSRSGWQQWSSSLAYRDEAREVRHARTCDMEVDWAALDAVIWTENSRTRLQAVIPGFDYIAAQIPQKKPYRHRALRAFHPAYVACLSSTSRPDAVPRLLTASAASCDGLSGGQWVDTPRPLAQMIRSLFIAAILSPSIARSVRLDSGG
jgi:hypothetical protein